MTNWSKFAVFAFAASITVTAVGVSSGLGHRFGWWDFGRGFILLKYAFYASFATIVVSLIGAILSRPGSARRGFGLALCGLLMSSAVAWVPFNAMRKIKSVPPIHDITTDTDNPPHFVAALAFRGNTSNSTEYAGEAVAKLQREGYPDIQPFQTNASVDQSYEAALVVVKYLGWALIAADKPAGRIEATDTTLWFGFKDDVVIRLTPNEQGTRIDVRSISRVGGSDAGANAARVRIFLNELVEHLGSTQG